MLNVGHKKMRGGITKGHYPEHFQKFDLVAVADLPLPLQAAAGEMICWDTIGETDG
jgi:hypothetical protein